MSTLAKSVRRLFGELRRRKVINTFVLYVVTCWVILQVCSVAFPIYDIDNRYYNWVFAAFFIVSPFVIAVSWFYQFTPRGFIKIAPFVERRALNNLIPRGDRRSSSDKFHDREDARWSIIAESGPVQGLEYTITKPIVIGRSLDCDLTLTRSYISREHVRLSVENETLLIEDLDSSNGTWVNGLKVQDSQVLHDGDELTFKDVIFRIKENASESRSDALFNQTIVIGKS